MKQNVKFNYDQTRVIDVARMHFLISLTCGKNELVLGTELRLIVVPGIDLGEYNILEARKAL